MLLYRKILAAKIFIITLLICLWTACPCLAAEGNSDEETVAVMSVPHAAASVLIEANSGQMLFGVNQDLALPPASTTKILTALLALDLDIDMEKPHSISQEAAAVGDASLSLRVGEQLSLESLLEGALAHSGNDACYAIAEIAAGGEKLFVHWMNMKAAVIGAYSVHMENTNGLPAPNHQMSALDLAIIARYAMRNDFFAKTVASKYVEFGEGKSYRYYKNTNKLLWQSDNVVGIKTGTTDAAGRCLVAAYKDGAALYISVVLDSPDRYGESLALFNYGANNYLLFDMACTGSYLAYLPDEDEGVMFKAEKDLSVLLKQEQAEQLKLVWRLNRDQGSLALENSSGEILAKIILIVETNKRASF